MLALPDFCVSISARQNAIYFANGYGGGVKVYSEETSDVETFVNITDPLYGVAWDAKGEQLYFSTWSSPSTIYRSNADGTAVTTVFTSSTCESYSPRENSYIFFIWNLCKCFPV